MAVGIIIHVSVGKEKRTEYFGEEFIRIGSDETSELQIHTAKISDNCVWLTLAREDEVYRIIDFGPGLGLTHNGEPIRRFAPISDGDTIAVKDTGIEISFFSLTSESALITTNREPHQVQFIEEAAIGASVTEKRDDAKAFLREFSRELLREISWRSKALYLALFVTLMIGLFYLGYGFYRETRSNSAQVAEANKVINDLKERISQTNKELGELNESNKIVRDIVSLAPNLRVEYGNGVCLIVGVYDLVDRKTGRQLKYPDPAGFRSDPYEPPPMEEGIYEVPETEGLTTEGNGAPVRYDFIGTGFHVGNGFILTNRHVLQPWTEDDLIRQLISESGGRAKIRKLVVYFPNHTRAFPLTVRKFSSQQDIAVGFVNAPEFINTIPVLPVESGSESRAIGKTVVTMGYPNGPDRLLAMVDDEEAKSINRKFGSSRQALISYLAQSGKILPLTTQGSITDLDGKRIVHDAKTAEGGSGAPLFGQSGKVIGVNFGVFTENNASNMAIPIEYAITLLRELGWTSASSINGVASQPASSPKKTIIATTGGNP
ncbi:MAG: serine protease [Acidobacteriota bacterium]|nr:serine protease [Acidobacteriota bacterium]MDH3528072.1 serine protease [Acidobacteriota bacterium]